MQQSFNQVNRLEKKTNSSERPQTNKELESLRSALFNHKTSGRYLSTRILFKIIAGRYIKYGNCVTKQETLCIEMETFGYGKELHIRQVRKMCGKLRDAGLITYERSTKNRSSVYSYVVTELGLQCFDYFIRRNVQKLSTVSVNKKHWPKKSNLENQKKVPVETKKSAGRAISQVIDKYTNEKKKCRSNISYINNIGASPVSSFSSKIKSSPICGTVATPRLAPNHTEIVHSFCKLRGMDKNETLILLDDTALALTERLSQGHPVKDFDGFLVMVANHAADKYYWDKSRMAL